MINKIAVLGAGTMGHGIAEVFAMHGYDVMNFDPSKETHKQAEHSIRKELAQLAEHEIISNEQAEGATARIKFTVDMEEAAKDADYVIEATPENMKLKQDLFGALDRICKKEAIFASNTSSLPLREMTAFLPDERVKRFLVCHWYNPAHLMPLVELSYFGNMPDEIFCQVEDLYRRAGKQTIRVKRDVPGLVANRIQQGVAREAFSLMENGVADPEDIDKALKFGPAFRYATTGQLEVADMGGLDIWTTVADNLFSVIDNRTDANPILKKKVSEGKLGMKTGEGFFKYPPEEMDERRNKFHEKLIVQLKASKHYLD